jgi:hypothetical protein
VVVMCWRAQEAGQLATKCGALLGVGSEDDLELDGMEPLGGNFDIS